LHGPRIEEVISVDLRLFEDCEAEWHSKKMVAFGKFLATNVVNGGTTALV
jgi:hypothetical protein